MSTNINPNYNEETEQSNQLFNTQIPTLLEDADIQEALRLYHYGSSTTQPSQNNSIEPNSVAGHLKGLRDDISTLEALGLGSSVSETIPASPDDGYIWADVNSAATVFDTGIPVVAYYQVSQPTTGLVEGMLWVDKDSSPLTMYVYDASLDSWRAIGS